MGGEDAPASNPKPARRVFPRGGGRLVLQPIVSPEQRTGVARLGTSTTRLRIMEIYVLALEAELLVKLRVRDI